MHAPKYSVVIPFLNEQESVASLYDRLQTATDGAGQDIEFVFVDDGSTDRTFQLLKEIAGIDSRVTVIRMRHRFGKTAALVAGFERARGKYIVAMDGDLQHDPADIPRFLEKLEEGYDVVCGWREKRIDNLWFRKIPSRVANWAVAKLSGVDIHDFGGGFKGYRREIINELPLYGELQRFIPALASSYGASVCEIPIRTYPRPHGASHYGISRVIPVFFDIITIYFLRMYLARPLHFFGSWGVLTSMGGLGIAGWLLLQKMIFGTHIMSAHGPLMIFAVVLLLAGCQLLGLGLLGEMQVRHYHELSRRGRYSVAEIVHAESNAEPEHKIGHD
ncbi:MAG: glycosyltransferase family 2 protein [Candidatus Acidiferrales bacterium]